MATVYLNAATGNDANSYAQAQNPATPWLTPGKVQTSATTGDTVIMAAGTYTYASVSFTKAFTWVGAALSNGVPTTVLDGANANAQWGFNGGTTQLSNILFQNVTVSSAGSAFCLTNATTTATFTSCMFKNITNTNAGGFLFYNFSTNSILNFTGCAFFNCYTSATNATSCTFFSSNGAGSVINITNCTFVWTTTPNVTTAIFRLSAAATEIVGKNSIFRNATANSYPYRTAAIDVTATYCCFNGWTNNPAGTGNITSDPQFVDAANGNFNLRATSPCLGTGSL